MPVRVCPIISLPGIANNKKGFMNSWTGFQFHVTASYAGLGASLTLDQTVIFDPFYTAAHDSTVALLCVL